MSFAVILLVVAVGSSVRAELAVRDDGWRRTAQGWERMAENRKVTPMQVSTPAPRRKGGHLPLHPLLFAAVQVSLIAAAYWRLPVKT